jgi:3-oxoacyl-[acyl-carrier protein] reductase
LHHLSPRLLTNEGTFFGNLLDCQGHDKTKGTRSWPILQCVGIWGRKNIDNLLLSNALRAGVVGLAKTLSNQFAGDGITVNNVCPGYTRTDRVTELNAGRARELGISVQDVEQQVTANIPLGRMGWPKELAALITFLASERASYITGTTIQVDGGYIKGLL